MSRSKKIAVGSTGLVLVTALIFMITQFFWNPLTPLQTESQRLDAAIEEADRRIELADELIVALIEGRASLDQAARDFLKLHENNPGFVKFHAIHNTGQTPLESAARDMANRAYNRAQPHQQELLAKRLTDEFRVLFPEVEPLQFDPIPTPGHIPPLARQPGGRAIPMPPPHNPPVGVPYQ